MTLDIAKDTSITVPDKKTFTNHGKIDVKGTFPKEEERNWSSETVTLAAQLLA